MAANGPCGRKPPNPERGKSVLRFARLVLTAGAAGLALGGCSATPDPFLAWRSYAPEAAVVAQPPLFDTGSERYPDHDGQAVALSSAPALDDTGGERMPDFPAGGPAMAAAAGAVIMPNGGERPVESVASQP